MKTVQVAKGLTKKEGIQKVIKKALQHPGVHDCRSATYNPKTGKGTVR
jgi:hypothetical protein